MVKVGIYLRYSPKISQGYPTFPFPPLRPLSHAGTREAKITMEIDAKVENPRCPCESRGAWVLLIGMKRFQPYPKKGTCETIPSWSSIYPEGFPYLGCAYRDEQSWATDDHLSLTKWRAINEQPAGGWFAPLQSQFLLSSRFSSNFCWNPVLKNQPEIMHRHFNNN